MSYSVVKRGMGDWFSWPVDLSQLPIPIPGFPQQAPTDPVSCVQKMPAWVWDPINNKCIPASQTGFGQQVCTASGGVWDPVLNSCRPKIFGY